uniref:Uncharacterized protein n=1 Tax=Ditylenchus dipsaci TaxID=166011 RepID=A0A915ERC2_9BILA
MAKVEVQIRSCFCCGLTPGSIFIALYTLLLYSLLTGLASWALSDTTNNGDSSYYTSCELEGQGKIRADNRKLTFQGGQTTVIVEDSTSYHCSFGLYTEEMKYSKSLRYSTLVFDIFLYVLLILASVILLVGLALYNQWFLIPWMVLIHGNLARIATGIFFLGLQFFHISILLIIIAKFQRIHNRKKGLVVDGVDKQYDPRVYGVPAPPASIPSNYNGYSPSSQLHRNGSAAPPPPIMAGNQAVYGQPPYSDYSPSSHNVPPPQQRGYYEPRY